MNSRSFAEGPAPIMLRATGGGKPATAPSHNQVNGSGKMCLARYRGRLAAGHVHPGIDGAIHPHHVPSGKSPPIVVHSLMKP